MLLDGSIPALPHFGFNVVDVRDIAALQLLAMTVPSAAGQRFIGSCDFYWMTDIAKILKQGLGDKARKVPSFPVPDLLVRVIAIFDPVARGRLYELGKRGGDRFDDPDHRSGRRETLLTVRRYGATLSALKARLDEEPGAVEPWLAVPGAVIAVTAQHDASC